MIIYNDYHIVFKNIKQKRTKMLIFLLLFNLFVTQDFQPYNSFFLESFSMLVVVYDTKIVFYSSTTFDEKKNNNLGKNQKITSNDEGDMISLITFNEDNYQEIYMIVKNYLYNFNTKGKLNTYLKIDYINNKVSDLVAYKCNTIILSSYCYVFIAFLDSNSKLNILEFSHIINGLDINYVQSKSYYLINSSGGTSKSYSNNVSCQIMIKNSSEKILTCFYENNYSQMGALLISPQTLDRYNKDIPSLKQNSGAVNIKSILFNSASQAFVCYVNDNTNIACLIYDINENKWGEEYKYLEKMDLTYRNYNIDYFASSNQFILSCFNSDSQYEFAMFDENMEIVDTNFDPIYCLTNKTIEFCSESNIPFVKQYYEEDSYKLVTICDADEYTIDQLEQGCNKKYEKMKIIVEDITIPIVTDIDSPTTNIDQIIEITEIPGETNKINEANKTNEISKTNETSKTNKTNKTLNEIIDDLDSLVKSVNDSQVYERKSDGFIIKISPINHANFEHSSTYINFSFCENNLRREYNLPPDAVLKVVMIELEKNDNKALTNQVEYDIYYNGSKLNLSACKNDEIEINYDITNSTLLDMNLVSKYSELGIDILDSSDQFFVDICYPYSENNSDMILKDRILDLYQNFSMCDENCKYDKINLESKIITCKCSVKAKIQTSILPLRFDSIILDLVTNSSFGVVKCYNLVFNFKTKLNNIGFWIFLILIIIHIPLFIHYFIYGVSPIGKYIINEMKKYHYLRKVENPLKRHRKKASVDKYNPNFVIGEKLIYNEKCDNINEKIDNKTKQKESKSNINIYNENHDVKIFSSSIMDDNNKKYKKNYSSKKNILKTQKISKRSFHQKRPFNLEDKKLGNEYFLIQINANNSGNNIPIESKILLDNYDYEDAIKYDKRSFIRIYYICILSKENILNMFLINSPLELKSIRWIIFILIYSCDFALNTVFYFNDHISDKYHYEGNNLYLFTTFNNFIISFISTLLSFSIVNALQLLTNSKDEVEELFRIEEKKMRQNKKYKVSFKRRKHILKTIYEINRKLKIKIIIFIILEFLIMLFFFYFVTAFCEVYNKTQISWIIDSFVSFILSFPMEFLYALFIAIVYKISISVQIKWLYKLIMVFYSLG